MRWSLRTLTPVVFIFFFFNDTATTEIYTLSLHDALPISYPNSRPPPSGSTAATRCSTATASTRSSRSEEHTSELQSQSNLVCRLLLEKKKKPRPQPAHCNRLTGRTSASGARHQRPGSK